MEESLRGAFDARAEAVRAREAERAEFREMQARERVQGVRALGERAVNLVGGGLVQEMDELGILDAPIDLLAKGGWSPAAIRKLEEVRTRLVPVEGSKVSGQGFVTVSKGDKLFAYVGAGENVAAFEERYGPGGRVDDAFQGDLNQWFGAPGGFE